MPRSLPLCSLALVACAVASARPAAAQSSADVRSRSEVIALFRAFNDAWERRDAAFIDRYYAHDSTGVFFFERRQLQGWPRVDTLYRNMFANAARIIISLAAQPQRRKRR